MTCTPRSLRHTGASTRRASRAPNGSVAERSAKRSNQGRSTSGTGSRWRAPRQRTEPPFPPGFRIQQFVEGGRSDRWQRFGETAARTHGGRHPGLPRQGHRGHPPERSRALRPTRRTEPRRRRLRDPGPVRRPPAAREPLPPPRHPVLHPGVPDRGRLAQDGYPIVVERDATAALPTDADLDRCHGRTAPILLDGQVVTTYHYSATSAFPYVVGCFEHDAGAGSGRVGRRAERVDRKGERQVERRDQARGRRRTPRAPR